MYIWSEEEDRIVKRKNFWAAEEEER